jgi:hypothetical protein
MNLVNGSGVVGKNSPDLCAHGIGVGRRARYTHPQAWPGALIVEEPGLCSVLSDRQVEAAVSVKVANRGAPPFSINLQPAQLPGHRFKASAAIPTKQNSTPGIAAHSLGLHFKEVLGHKQVFLPIAVKIAGANSEARRELRLIRKRHGLKLAGSIQKHRRG